MGKQESTEIRPFVAAFCIIFIIAFFVIKIFDWRVPKDQRPEPAPLPPIEEYLNQMILEHAPEDAELEPFVGPEAQTNEEIDIGARDGEPLQVRFTKPAGEGPFPVMVIVHGVSSSAPLTNQVSSLYGEEFANNLNMMVAVVDWRDSQFGEGDFTDVVSAIDWASSLEEKGDEPVILFGLDHGAYLSLLAANEVPVDGIISAYGYADLYEQYLFLQEQQPDSAPIFLEKSGCKNVVDTNSCLRQLSLRDRLNITVPTLIIHGADDTSVPPSQSELLRSLIDESHVQYTLLDSDNVDEQIAHVFDNSGALGHQQAMDTLYNWLDQNYDLQKKETTL